MTEPLHFVEEGKWKSYNCWWCATDLDDVVRSTPSKMLWDAAADSCRALRPLTLEVFDQSDLTTQFRFDDAVVEISDDLLDARLKQFTPLVHNDKGFWTFEPVHVRNTAFTWSPKIVDQVIITEEVGVTPTYHSCAYYGFFKPSISEVLAQLPDDIDANAFWIDTNNIKLCHCGGGQIAKTHWVKI